MFFLDLEKFICYC